MWGLLLTRWNRTSYPMDTILSPRMLVVITFVSDERLAWLTLARGAEWIGRHGKTTSSVFPVMCGTYFNDINTIPSSYRSMRVVLWWRNCSCCLADLALLSAARYLRDLNWQCIDCILIRYLFFLSFGSESFLCVSSVSTPCYSFTGFLFKNNCVHMTAFCWWMSMSACLERFEVDEERGFAD